MPFNDLTYFYLQYYRYAGVQHVYLYDCWRKPGEQLGAWLQPAIDSGFVTYIDWHKESMLVEADPKADHISVVEVPARTHCQKNYGDLFTWVLHTDVDEFPFASNDTQSGFLTRFLQSAYVRSHPQTVEHTMNNFLMLGWRNYTRGPCVMQQVLRRTIEIGNQLVKPIVLSKAISGSWSNGAPIMANMLIDIRFHEQKQFAKRSIFQI
jgi:hypothetical protein